MNNNLSGYYKIKYDTCDRFASYWYQIKEIVDNQAKTILEIGIGNGLVSKYLKERGIDITTLDKQANLRPDILGNILNLPFKDKSFDLISCSETLEHLPYENFSQALSEIKRVTNNLAIITLPDANFYFKVRWPKNKIEFKIQKKRKGKNQHHFWEIGLDGSNNQKVESKIKQAGFKIIKTYRPFEMPYHRFFILKK